MNTFHCPTYQQDVETHCEKCGARRTAVSPSMLTTGYNCLSCGMFVQWGWVHICTVSVS